MSPLPLIPHVTPSPGTDHISTERTDGGVPLVGRTPELEILRGELRLVADGRFRFILIDGAAGVGKSRLMHEIVEKHRNEAEILSARSYQLGVTTSFGPWLEALDRHALSTGDSRIRERIGVTGGSGLNRELLLHEVTSILARLSEEGPILVAIDDMHLADASSWEALRFVARRLWNRPVGVLATARSGGLRSRPLIGDVLHALGDDAALRRVNVRPLNTDELAELARARLRHHPDRETLAVPQSLVDWLVDRSLGTPCSL